MEYENKIKKQLINGLRELRRHISGKQKTGDKNKRGEDEVITLKKQIEFILGATKTGLDIIDSKFNIRYIDSEWEKVYGDPTGKKCYEYFMDRNEVCLNCGIPEALKTKKTVVTEEILFKESNRPIQVTTIPFQDSKGEWLVAEVNVDITERKRAKEALKKSYDEMEMRVQERTAELTKSNQDLQTEIAERKEVEKALKASEEKYRNLYDNAPDMYHSLDSNGIIIDCNETESRKLGYKKEEIIGRPLTDFFTEESKRLFEEDFPRLNYEKVQLNLEREFIRKDGTAFLASLNVYSEFDESGRLVSTRTMARDITEHKRAEETIRESEKKYRSLFENSRDVIYITTREGRFIDVNQSALETFGYSREEMVGMDVLKIYINPEDRIRFQREMEQWGSVRDYEIKFRKKNGTEMFCLMTSTLQRDKDGNILGYQGIIRDVTEKRKMEDEILRVQKLESIGILAGGIAHDFNNILTAIMGNISLSAMYVKPGDEVFKRLKEAEKASLYARDLTQQLLTFSKGGTPVKKTISIGDLIKESVGFALRGSKTKCEYIMQDDIWPVEVDEGQMNQVINNLAINADQSMPEGGMVKVCVENIVVSEKDCLSVQHGKYVKITIEDDGIGISKEHLKKIFDPYFTTKQKGSGLGLAITYSIIMKHDGYITVESELETGTKFSIYLPVSQKQVPEKESAREIPVFGSGKVLLMDDEEIIRDVAGGMLKQIGYDVEFARNGAEAIELYKNAKESSCPFSAVIMDLTIPGGMGGREALQRLLKIDPEIKAIVTSGYSNDPVMADFREYGFCDIIAKPYRIMDLSKVLHRVITGESENNAY